MSQVYEVKKPMSGNAVKKIIIAAVVVVLVGLLLAATVTIIPTGHTGVILTMGKASESIMSEGLNFKAPFIQQVKVINNQIQMCEIDSAEAVSKDMQSISSTIAVNFRVGYESSVQIYKNIGLDYQNSFLMPAIQESLKSVSAKYTAEELISQRTQVALEMKETLEEKVEDYGMQIERFNIVNFTFSDEFNAAIEAKQVAEQNLIKTQTEQQQAIVIAEAEAKKKLIAADAQAEATLKVAEAQAQANELLNASLSDLIIKNNAIEKWDGVMPKVTGSSSLIDIPLE